MPMNRIDAYKATYVGAVDGLNGVQEFTTETISIPALFCRHQRDKQSQNNIV